MASAMIGLPVLCLACFVCAAWGLDTLPPQYRSRLVTLGDAQLDDGPIVETDKGPVLGRVTVSAKESEVEEFLGIPYAEPPTGPRRWKKPDPLGASWPGVLNGTVYGMHCIQGITDLYPLVDIGGEHSEDCLTVNVYRPKERSGPLPVFVFIYGGGFNIGTGEMYPGSDLAAIGELIVVNFNYRLSVLGFLSTGDSEAPGNYGLWDARQALIWVKDNIAAFGGDPSRVTLAGQSAGGAAVSHCLLSPETRGLLHRAFPMSGSATAVFASTRLGRQSAFALADYFNCSADTSEEVVECLMEVDGDVLFEAGAGIGQWSPVIDGEFIPIDPHDAWAQGAGSVKDVPLLTGSTIHDAAGFVLVNPIGFPLINDSLNVANDKETLFEVIRVFLSFAENDAELFDLIIAKYPGLDSADNMTRTLAATQMFTDGLFEHPSHDEATFHAQASGVGTYRYMYEYRQSFFAEGYPPWVQGSHLDDIYTFLGPVYFQSYRDNYLWLDFDQADLKFSSDTMKYMANFAYTGNPNSGPFTAPGVWPQYSAAEKEFLHMSPGFGSMRPDAERLDKYAFWHDLPVVPREPEDDDKRVRQSRSLQDIALLAEERREELYKLVGYYEPAMDIVDDSIDRVLEKMGI